MGNKTYLLFGIPLLALAFIFLFSSSLINNSQTISDEPLYSAMVEIQTTGDFEGRISEPHQGELELVGINHNLLTDAGAEAIEQILGQGTSYSAYNYIALDDASSGGGTPASGDTTLESEYTNSGLSRASGTYGSLAGNGNYSIYHTFTSSANDKTTNVTGLFNQSTVAGSGMLAINSFTLVTLQSADQLCVNWTISIKDGS